MDEITALKIKYDEVKSKLNERERRHWAAGEARRLGRGGVSLVSRATGLSRTTINKGLGELESGHALSGQRVRREGGGGQKKGKDFKSVSISTITEALDDIIEPTTSGDFHSPFRWTTLSVKKITRALKDKGLSVSNTHIYNSLSEQDYHFIRNQGACFSGKILERNQQFEFINQQAATFLRKEWPVIVVSTQAKQKTWKFRGPDLGPYLGWENIGIDDKNAECVVKSIRQWWKSCGDNLYPTVQHLYIAAGGCAGRKVNTRLWEYFLQKFSVESGLTIHVSHIPSGGNKWNKIEYRLINYIPEVSLRPWFTCLRVIVEQIGQPTSRTELKERKVKDSRDYMTIREVSNMEFATAEIIRNEFFGNWNYKIVP